MKKYIFLALVLFGFSANGVYAYVASLSSSAGPFLSLSCGASFGYVPFTNSASKILYGSTPPGSSFGTEYGYSDIISVYSADLPVGGFWKNMPSGCVAGSHPLASSGYSYAQATSTGTVYTYSHGFGKLLVNSNYYCLYDRIYPSFVSADNRGAYIVDPNPRASSYSCASTYRGFELVNFAGANPAGASCTDGVKNQDEQGIDFGGVCGTPAGKTILCQTGSLSTSYTYAPITPSYTGGTDDIITTSPYTRYLSGSSFIDRFYDSSRYYTISTSNLTVSSGALSSFMNSGSTLSVTTVWGVPPGPATLDIKLFQNTKANYVKVNAPSTLQFRVKYDAVDFGLYLDPTTYKGGDYVRFDSTNHFQITFADSTFTLNSLEWGTFTPVYTLGQMCQLIETNLVQSMSGSTLGFDAVGLSNVISQITASGSTGSGATLSISSTFGFCNGDFTVLGFDLGSKICAVFTKTEGYINDQLNYKQFFSLINPYVPTTPPPLTFQTPIPKWYSDNTWGITYATGSLTDVMALKLPINRLAPSTTTRAVVVAFSLFLYFAFYALTLVVFFWPILYAMKIVQKIMDLATGFVMGKRVTNGNLFSLPVLFWYYTGYASLVLIVIKFSSNFTPVLTSAQGWIFTFISFINQAWGNYPTFMLVTNSIFVAILGLVLGQIILKLSNFSLRLN